MREMDIKLYPKTTKDTGGIKFYFNHQNKHYTIRPAGKPILLLEASFKLLGGTDFNGAYENSKNGIAHPEKGILKSAIDKTQDMLAIMEEVSNMGKSPFVVYIRSRNEFKS